MMFDYILPPLIIFMVIVAPIWIVMHYSTKKKMHSQLTTHDQNELQLLESEAEKMAMRIETLEAILDAETPEWRKRSREQLDNE